MTTTLLLKHIELGTIECDEMAGTPTPNFKTFIEGVGYNVIMQSYSYNFINDALKIRYLLAEYSNDWCYEEYLYEFDSTKEVTDDEWKDFYELKEIEEN